MASTIIKLKNWSPLHLGIGKEDYDFSAPDLHSDSISSALAALRAQRGKTDDIESFLDAFVLSSAFPFLGEHLFFPKTIGQINVEISGKEKQSSRKELKKIKYIEKDLWLQLLSGKCVIIDEKQLNGEFLLEKTTVDLFVKPFENQVTQRVTIPREEGQDAKPFFFNWTYFHENAGLFCILQTENDALREEIVDLFEELGETGIGSDRNVGGGKFEIEEELIDFLPQTGGNASMLLSLYIPLKEEIQMLNLEKSRYDLKQRGGFLAGSSDEEFRHLRKKSIYVFGVGSVFPTRECLKGKVVELTPKWNDSKLHPVFRSGKPFYVSVNLKEYE